MKVNSYDAIFSNIHLVPFSACVVLLMDVWIWENNCLSISPLSYRNGRSENTIARYKRAGGLTVRWGGFLLLLLNQ